MPQKKQEDKQQRPENIAANSEAVNALSDNEMNALLAQLVESKYWNAILRYNRSIDASTLNSLASIDPFKEPTLVARSQGLRIGLYHMEQTAFREFEDMRKSEEADAESSGK